MTSRRGDGATMTDVRKMLFMTCAICGSSLAATGTGRPKKYCDSPKCRRAAAAAWQRNRRQRSVVPVTTVTFGTNDQLIAEVARCYLADGDVVADVTYSSGRFWKKTDTSRYRFLASDLMPMAPGVIAANFSQLPYADGSIGALVFDPPYIHSPGKAIMADRYNGRQTTGMINSHEGIMQLYRDGMTEAARVLRDGGQLWVKCKDTIASEKQRWSHIDIYEMGAGLGMYARDLFLLVSPAPMNVTTNGRWARQIHARKVQSYLWVFETGGYRRRT